MPGAKSDWLGTSAGRASIGQCGAGLPFASKIVCAAGMSRCMGVQQRMFYAWSVPRGTLFVNIAGET